MKRIGAALSNIRKKENATQENTIADHGIDYVNRRRIRKNTMCGIYGFISAAKEHLSIDYLDAMVRITEMRGDDANGYALLTRRNKLVVHKAIGKLSKQKRYKAHLRRMSAAKILIGHCRLTTHGDEKRMHNNHPHNCNAGLLVHNGIVSNHMELQKQFGLKQHTECDTEIIGRLIDHMVSDSIGLSVAMAFEYLFGYGNAIAMIAQRKLVLARNGNPICYSMDDDMLTFASSGIALSDAKDSIYEMSDAMVMVLHCTGDRKIECAEYQTIDTNMADAAMVYDMSYGSTVNTGKRGAPLKPQDIMDEYDLYRLGYDEYIKQQTER